MKYLRYVLVASSKFSLSAYKPVSVEAGRMLTSLVVLDV